MNLDVGKYRGRDLADVPTDYLEWALGHLRLSEEMAAAVTAEYCRRSHEAQVAGETPVRRAWDRVARALTRFTARHGIRLPVLGGRGGSSE